MLFSFFLLTNLKAAKKESPLLLVLDNDTLPEVNNQIIAFVDAHLHHKVGYGECWDLAAIPLNNSNAKWDKRYVFGKLLQPDTDSIFPGDIIQFEGVVITTRKENYKATAYLEHHTAIIYKVWGNKKYTLAQQNTSDLGRKVGFGEIDLSHLDRGRYMIYRPSK